MESIYILYTLYTILYFMEIIKLCSGTHQKSCPLFEVSRSILIDFSSLSSHSIHILNHWDSIVSLCLVLVILIFNQILFALLWVARLVSWRKWTWKLLTFPRTVNAYWTLICELYSNEVLFEPVPLVAGKMHPFGDIDIICKLKIGILLTSR